MSKKHPDILLFTFKGENEGSVGTLAVLLVFLFHRTPHRDTPGADAPPLRRPHNVIGPVLRSLKMSPHGFVWVDKKPGSSNVVLYSHVE